MNYRQARIFLIASVIIAVLLIGGFIIRPFFAEPEPIEEGEDLEPELPITSIPETEPQLRNLHISQRVHNLAKQFADLNDAHLVYARRIGIKPISSTRDIIRLERPIVHIKSGDHYHIDRLTHSYPYLVPEAAELLDTIGVRFSRKLELRGGGKYSLQVTSLLRTHESVKRLSRRNVNSTSNSAHLYGTTFDISYVRFHEAMFNTRKLNDGQLKNILAEVLLELRDQGKCLVKFERKQSCFHITATGN